MPGSSASVTAVNAPPICTAGMVAEDDPTREWSYTRSMIVLYGEQESEDEGLGPVVDLSGELTAQLFTDGATEAHRTVFPPGSTEED